MKEAQTNRPAHSPWSTCVGCLIFVVFSATLKRAQRWPPVLLISMWHPQHLSRMHSTPSYRTGERESLEILQSPFFEVGTMCRYVPPPCVQYVLLRILSRRLSMCRAPAPSSTAANGLEHTNTPLQHVSTMQLCAVLLFCCAGVHGRGRQRVATDRISGSWPQQHRGKKRIGVTKGERHVPCVHRAPFSPDTIVLLCCCPMRCCVAELAPHFTLRGRLKRSARVVQLFGRLAVLETHTLRY